MPRTAPRVPTLTALLLLLLPSGLWAAGRGPHSARDPQPAAPRVAPGDWPMYGHDAARTNYNNAETTLSARNLGAVGPRWQAYLGSNGAPSSSTPSVAGGRVYVGGSAASGRNFFAFDSVSGAPAWSLNLGYVDSCFNVGIGATAAISDGIVVAGGGDAAYYGLDASTGELIWREALNAGPSGFAWESPLLANGRAYLGVAARCDNPSVRGEVRALDLYAGNRLANRYFVPVGRAGAGVWNSPALSPDGGTLVAVTGEDFGGYDGPYNRAIVALDPQTLNIRQANKQGATGQDLDWGTTPVIFHDSRGRGLVGANHKNGVFYTYLLNNINAGPIWQRAIGVSEGMMPAYDPSFSNGGTLFIAGGGGQLYAVDPATGADRWPTVAIGPMHGHMAVANGLVYVNSNGGIQVLDEIDGTLLRTLTPEHAGPAYSGVVVSHSFLYWMSGAYLNAWSLPGPTPTPGGPTPTPTAITPTPPPCVVQFRDVSLDAYFYEPVRYLYCHHILSGYADGTFRPFADTTRAQVVKIITAAFHTPAFTPTEPTFSDVPATHPFYAPIEAAAHAGLVNGYADHTFRPNNNITRAQFAKIAVAAAEWLPLPPAAATFHDVPPTNPFYTPIETAFCHDLISGYTCGGPSEPCDSTSRRYFRANANATRGQIAKIVMSALLGGGTCASK